MKKNIVLNDIYLKHVENIINNFTKQMNINVEFVKKLIKYSNYDLKNCFDTLKNLGVNTENIEKYFLQGEKINKMMYKKYLDILLQYTFLKNLTRFVFY